MESHQASKLDASGTAKAVISCLQKLGVSFDLSQVHCPQTSIFPFFFIWSFWSNGEEILLINLVIAVCICHYLVWMEVVLGTYLTQPFTFCRANIMVSWNSVTFWSLHSFYDCSFVILDLSYGYFVVETNAWAWSIQDHKSEERIKSGYFLVALHVNLKEQVENVFSHHCVPYLFIKIFCLVLKYLDYTLW